MSIDEQIRDILMKSTPVNDNMHKSPQTNPAAQTAGNFGINIVGNKNVVINTGLLQLILLSCTAMASYAVLH